MALDAAEIANTLLPGTVPPADDPFALDIDTPDDRPAVFDGFVPLHEVIAVFYDPPLDPTTGTEVTPSLTVHPASTGTQLRLEGALVAELPPGTRIAPEDVALIPR